MTELIDNFKGAYSWLSNFSRVSITMPDGITYYSTEHAFQAYKTHDMHERRRIAGLSRPKDAKKAGRLVELREDWEEVKFKVMEEVIRLKFQHPHLREQLLATGDAELVEGNTWGDKIWGVCDGEGENHLGRILMKVRDEIRAGESE